MGIALTTLSDIPFFKEVVIMATTCDVCGFRENEVKGGSGIEERGTKITLKLTDPTDLTRDVLKVSDGNAVLPKLFTLFWQSLRIILYLYFFQSNTLL